MSKNTNRDYLIIVDVKTSTIREFNKLEFYINDKESHNIFVQLVIKESHDIINKYAPIDDPNLYELTMNIVKPTNEPKRITGKLISLEDGLYEFKLPQDCCDKVGTYVCELETIYNSRVTNSNRIKYRIKKSVLNDLDGVVDAPGYPIVIQLLDKLSDIEQYEEDRRANELARQLAEEQRQARFNALDSDMVDSIQSMGDKVVEVENRISAKEQAVDKLVTDTKKDINDYKVAKDTEIDEYKTAKDQQINEAITNQDNKINQAITNQDNKIDTAIEEQNNRITTVESNDTVQDNRLDALEEKDIAHETRITSAEEKNVEQDNRLDVAENRLNNIGEDIQNTIQPTIDTQNNRLDSIETVNITQDNRLDAIEIKNQQQDDRLLDVEKVNKKQEQDIRCLYGFHENTIDITEEGNSIYLQNSVEGHCEIDNIQGNTLVNCNKEPDKELILNGNINTSGDDTVTLTEGVDGGLVDVALEGNTLVNVSNTKDSTALPLDEELTYLYANTQYTVQFISYAAITADITLGGTKLSAQNIVKGLNRISITTPATLIDNRLIISGVGADIMEVLVTNTDTELMYFQGMKSVGECEELQVISTNSNTSLLNTQHLTHEPLRAVGDYKDRYVLIDGKWYIERNCREVVYNGNEDWIYASPVFKLLITDFPYKTNVDNKGSDMGYGICDRYPEIRGLIGNKDYAFKLQSHYIQIRNKDFTNLAKFKSYLNSNPMKLVYVLETPTYELIDYNPLEVYSNITYITTNSTIPANITVKNHGFNCLLKPNTTYTVSSNLGLNTVTTPSVLTEDCLRFIDTDTSDVTTMKDVLILEGDWTSKADLIPANFSGIESAFEQEYDAEKGKYKVNVKVTNEDKTKENNIAFYINEPLRGVGNVKDRIYVKDDKVVVERNCGQREYQDGDFGTYLTDKINTVYQLAEPTYEEIEYNDVKLFIESFKNSTLSYNSNVPVTSTVHYSYSVPIVDTVAQTANVTDQQDSMIIDLATQVAVMEMLLM